MTADGPTMSVRLPAELHARVKEAADERGLPIGFIVARAVEDYLPRLIPADEFRIAR